MGLDTSHGAWHGGYGSFHLWRQCLAKHYNVPLLLMEGYWFKNDFKVNVIREKCNELGTSYSEIFDENLPIKWDLIKIPHCLKVLLYHSDCGGDISPGVCGKLSKELFKASENIKSMFPRWTDLEVQELTKQFAEGCKEAHEANEKLDFH